MYNIPNIYFYIFFVLFHVFVYYSWIYFSVSIFSTIVSTTSDSIGLFSSGMNSQLPNITLLIFVNGILFLMLYSLV